MHEKSNKIDIAAIASSSSSRYLMISQILLFQALALIRIA